MIDKNTEAPWTDEDLGMSAPIKIGTYEFEASAREEVALRLEEISRFDYIATYHNPRTYTAAAEAIRQGVDGIRISGRFHRVREV
jgi:hypothetical protein